MKQSLVFCLLFVLTPMVSTGQTKASTAVQKNNVVISAGYGAPSIIRLFLKRNTNQTEYKIWGYGPYLLKASYFFHDRWSVNANFTYSFSRLSWMADSYDTVSHGYQPYEYGIEMEEISALLRVNYHFVRREKIDAYVGLGVGTGRIELGTYTDAPLNQFSVGFRVPKPRAAEATVGMRYFITNRIALYSEVGIGKSWILFRDYFIPESLIQAGACFKF